MFRSGFYQSASNCYMYLKQILCNSCPLCVCSIEILLFFLFLFSCKHNHAFKCVFVVIVQEFVATEFILQSLIPFSKNKIFHPIVVFIIVCSKFEGITGMKILYCVIQVQFKVTMILVRNQGEKQFIRREQRPPQYLRILCIKR